MALRDTVKNALIAKLKADYAYLPGIISGAVQAAFLAGTKDTLRFELRGELAKGKHIDTTTDIDTYTTIESAFITLLEDEGFTAVRNGRETIVISLGKL